MNGEARDGADQPNSNDCAAYQIAESVAPKIAPYNLRIIGKPALNDSGEVEGIVRNMSAVDWGSTHRVGMRLRDSLGNIIPGFEIRADFRPGPPRAGDKAYFRFDLSSINIAASTAYATIDVVHEGVMWLSEAGAQPTDIPAKDRGRDYSSDWLFWLDGFEGVDGDRLSLIETLVARIPTIHVSKGNQLRRLFEAEAEGGWYRPYRTDSATVALALSGPGDRSGYDLFIRHLATQSGYRIDPNDPEGTARLFNRFTLDAPNSFGGMTAPLPPDSCKWLSRRALPSAIASTPATRSMVATLGADNLLDLNPVDGGDAQFWKFATEVMIDRNVTAMAMPASVLRALAVAPADDRPQGFPPVTAFMRRIHGESAAYRAAYQLDRSEGRLAFVIDLTLASLENESFRLLLGQEIRAWLDEPLAVPSGISPLEIILLVAAKRPPPAIDTPNPVDLRHLRRTLGWTGRTEATTTDTSMRIIGLHSSSSGLGANMRMSETVLRDLGAPIELIDTRRNQVLPAETDISMMQLTRPIDLFHLNLDEVPALAGRYARRDRPDTYRIAFALWETSAMPEEHRAGLDLIDEIWAPTKYVADVYRNAGHPNVHVIGKGIDLPEPLPFDLAELGIHENANVFLVAFDLESWIDRKNPMAAVDAFRLAFPKDKNARLIVKNNGLTDHRGDRSFQVRRLEEAAQDDPRIILLSEFLPFRKYLGLIQAVTATLSPHRAEGFGYFPAYALMLGTPTIVTDYSGTVDFCSDDTSYPVRANLVTLRAGDFVFDALGAAWADIDVVHLADRMRDVVADPASALARTARGAALVRDIYSMSALKERYRARLAAIRYASDSGRLARGVMDRS